MATREMQIDNGVFEFHVAEQQLDGAQVGAGLKEMRRVRVAQRILTLPMNRPPRSFTTTTIRSTANA
jgi:hypothetical protein